MRLLFVCFLAAFGAEASAEALCQSGSADPISVTSWEVSDVQDHPNFRALTAVLSVDLPSNPVAVDGSITFLDPLGRNIFSIGIDPLPNVEDGLITIDFMGRMTGIANLAGIERLGPDLVTVITCTRRIAYADGSTENF